MKKQLSASPSLYICCHISCPHVQHRRQVLPTPVISRPGSARKSKAKQRPSPVSHGIDRTQTAILTPVTNGNHTRHSARLIQPSAPETDKAKRQLLNCAVLLCKSVRFVSFATLLASNPVEAGFALNAALLSGLTLHWSWLCGCLYCYLERQLSWL